MCLYPTLRQNRKYIANKKNGGIVPAITDNRTSYVPTPCGKCMECTKKRARDWQIRLLEEVREGKRAVFVTLTFSNESIIKLNNRLHKKDSIKGYDRDNAIAKLGTRLFLERWRKKFKKSVRHWLVTELGHEGTENIHLHGIIWTDEDFNEINEKWGYGYTWIGDEKRGGYVNEKTVNYITKYVNKVDLQHKEYNPKVLCSAGIGRGYMKRIDSNNNKYKEGETNEAYRNRQGFEMNLPTYYRNHLYSEEEKEKLWIEKLDKNIRWVNGQKVDISKGEDKYFKLLKQEQARNRRLGYGDNEINWDRKIYENDRRNMMFMQRIKERNNIDETLKPKTIKEFDIHEYNNKIGYNNPNDTETPF